MVYLKKVDTRGFKSLGSKLISTPVEPGFVAITGPNGSGKSNLLDAILFALGENSAKALRAANLQGLIFDGSIEQQKPSSAKVSIQFENSDRRIPVDSDSVTITRELKTSGESLYSINGKLIQRNKLLELLENALIASRGLNIVLQGMITRISELVPDEKRKLIEQMVGIAQFDEKKQLALTQLHDADNKLAVAMAKIGEIRDRVQGLEEQRNDQLRLKQLEDQIRWLRAASASTKLNAVRKMALQKKGLASEVVEKLIHFQSRLAEITKTVSDLEKERSALIESAVDSGTAKVEADLGATSNELTALKKERNDATEFLDKMRQISPHLSRMLEDQKTRIAQTESEIVIFQSKLEHIDSRKKVLLVEQTKLNKERTSFESELEAARNEIGAVRKEKEVEDLKLQQAKDGLNAAVSDKRLAEDRLLAIQDKMKFYADSLFEAKRSIEELGSLLIAQKAELGEMHDTKAKFDDLKKRVEAQLDIAALILEKTQNAVTKYDSDLSAIESVAAEEIALSRLESLGASSALKGYRGPLRSLISFDEKYSQAIAAIGRDWLNAVIVDDVSSLIKLAESSRKLKISRLTMIPISELKAFGQENSPPSIPGVLSSVTGVISCQRKIRKILNFIFGDSVIVDSPRNAFVAARKGFRAVTLRGDVFEPEILAFETGYSKRYAKINEILDNQENFQGIKTTLGTLRSVISKRRESLSKLQTKSERISNAELDRNLDISKVETKLESWKQFLGKYEEQLESLKAKLKDSEEEITRRQLSIEQSKTILDSQSIICQELSDRLSGMDLSSFEERNSEFTKWKNELDLKLEQIMAETREIVTDSTRVKGDLENSQKPGLERLIQQLSENQNSVSSKTKLLSDTEPRLGELEAKYAVLKAEEEKMLEKANRFKPMLEAVDYKLRNLKAEEETTRKSISSSEREQMASSLDLDRLLESERALFGQLSLFGYADPIETFEGAESLLKELSSEFDALRTNVNFIADRSYREVFENYKYSSVRKNELEKERNAIVTFIETIDSEKRKVFMEAFEKIDRELRVIFTKITNGAAWLEIENPDSIFDSGLFLMTQFPGKIPRDSSAVSGGEKTISALSFILAIQAVFPSPFYMFDEVDAHLDSVYSGKLGEILAERSSFSQIIIVSLKDNVVSKANSVIGVYMSQTDGSSKIIRYRTGMEVEVKAE
ncbi:MAG TPA: chromosome segregation SMC family protein [Nitrososphaerales archaeon]|nr:chromosome segregation SMC family protein [Nitrososphaerales archaeon]